MESQMQRWAGKLWVKGRRSEPPIKPSYLVEELAPRSKLRRETVSGSDDCIVTSSCG